ncbi:MAG: sodium/proton antiporter [Candidatus Omnitrophica bacterium]|nr:sodium/proton antiporter [Candidatus Omnitrophota bacterium]
MNKFFNNISQLFMGEAPRWYKIFIAGILLFNPLAYFTVGPFWTGWLVLIEFLFILGFSLSSYPLFPGGLVALEVFVLNMVPPILVMKEITANIDVILLLIFLVPSIFFMKPLLIWIFMRIFSCVKSKVALSLVFLVMGAFLSAWLDALTVMAVIMSVCLSVKEIFLNVKSELPQDSEEFNGFLRNLLMHAAIGTTIGGVATMIGEPQNLLIAHYAGWGFQEFFVKMAHFSIPVQIAGVLTCFCLEHFRMKAFGFGYQLPDRVAVFLEKNSQDAFLNETSLDKLRLIIMAGAFACLVLALAFQIAPVGIVGLGLLIGLPILTGQTQEHQLGKAFEESLPFTALLAVFFVIVAMIENLGLFAPLTQAVLQFQSRGQLYAFFLASGVLSSVSDNVFVANVYIHQAHHALGSGLIDKLQFDCLAIVINAGTNIFSIITPNGQAAFLFLLTSTIARRINLSYGRMFWMSFPYAVTLVLTAIAML